MLDNREKLRRAYALLKEAIQTAKEDRQYALLEILVLLRRELETLEGQARR